MAAPGLSRRNILGAAATAPLLAELPGASNAAPLSPPAGKARSNMTVTLKINGRERQLAIDPRVTLLDALR